MEYDNWTDANRMMSVSWEINPMQEEDMDAVMAIEGESFQSPWSRESFLNDLNRSEAVSLVGTQDHQIIGYLVAWLVIDEVHIGNLAVHPDWRRRGLAQALIDHLYITQPQLNWAWLEVRKSNEAARQLYQKMGFKEISIRKNYYEVEKEDAIVMVKDLRHHE